MNKPRRIRIYKLSAFDTFTKEERALNEAYKKAGIKERATLKKIRDDVIASYGDIRKIDRKKLYTYEYDKDGKVIEESENVNKQIALFESEMVRYTENNLDSFPLIMDIVYMKIAYQTSIFSQILDRGLLIDDKKYVFFTSTTSQMKDSEFVLVQEDFYNNNQNRNCLSMLSLRNSVKSTLLKAVRSGKKQENVCKSYIIPVPLLYQHSYTKDILFYFFYFLS